MAENMALDFIERFALLKESMYISDKSGKILNASTTIKLPLTQRKGNSLQSRVRPRLHPHSR